MASGKPAEGWTKMGVVVPDQFVQRLTESGYPLGPGGMKTVWTAAASMFLALPEDVRKKVLLRVVEAGMGGARNIKPVDVFRTAIDSMYQRAELEGSVRDQEQVRYLVSRILDPEVTPEPGEKASDRAKQERKAKGV